jgi:hypothetical protein
LEIKVIDTQLGPDFFRWIRGVIPSPRDTIFSSLLTGSSSPIAPEVLSFLETNAFLRKVFHLFRLQSKAVETHTGRDEI